MGSFALFCTKSVLLIDRSSPPRRQAYRSTRLGPAHTPRAHWAAPGHVHCVQIRPNTPRAPSADHCIHPLERTETRIISHPAPPHAPTRHATSRTRPRLRPEPLGGLMRPHSAMHRRTRGGADAPIQAAPRAPRPQHLVRRTRGSRSVPSVALRSTRRSSSRGSARCHLPAPARTRRARAAATMVRG